MKNSIADSFKKLLSVCVRFGAALLRDLVRNESTRTRDIHSRTRLLTKRNAKGFDSSSRTNFMTPHCIV